MILTRTQALAIIRRAYGPDVAESLADRLPKHLDLDHPPHAELLRRLGVTRDGLFNALGAEL
jgi:hypothetical protein